MPVLEAIRLVLLTTTLCCSIVILGINAYVISLSGPWYTPDEALGLATACLTVLIIGTSLIIDRLDRGAITSLVMIELAWVGVLWPLWLSTAAVNVVWLYWWGYFKPLPIFSFLNWLMLFGWWVTLLASSVRAASKGISEVWRTPVREHLGRSKNTTSATTYPTVPANYYGGPAPGHLQPSYGMPLQQQQPYWPQQGYGMPPPQQPYGTPQPQQGYGTPAPQQGYGTPQPQAMYGASALGSPPDTSQG